MHLPPGSSPPFHDPKTPPPSWLHRPHPYPDAGNCCHVRQPSSHVCGQAMYPIFSPPIFVFFLPPTAPLHHHHNHHPHHHPSITMCCFWASSSSSATYSTKKLRKNRPWSRKKKAMRSRVSQLPPTIPSSVMLPARAACESKLTLGLFRDSVFEAPSPRPPAPKARVSHFREASWLFR
jgi:hypothetical protein